MRFADFVALGLAFQPAAGAVLGGAPLGVAAHRVRGPAPRMQSPEDSGDGDSRPEDQDAGVADFRAQLMRQMMGGSADSGVAAPNDRERLMRSVETATLATGPAAGVLLIADPSKFCSRNPFARPVKDLARFGLDGPVAPGEMPADLTAQMLPVVLLLEHGPKGSFGVLLERRTGAPKHNTVWGFPSRSPTSTSRHLVRSVCMCSKQ